MSRYSLARAATNLGAGSPGLPLGVARRPSEDLGGAHRPATDRFVREARPATLALEDLELVVQPRQVLLDGGLGDDELTRDLTDRRRFTEDFTRDHRAAERHQDVSLPR